MGSVNVFICIAIFGSWLEPLSANRPGYNFGSNVQNNAAVPVFLQNPAVHRPNYNFDLSPQHNAELPLLLLQRPTAQRPSYNFYSNAQQNAELPLFLQNSEAFSPTRFLPGSQQAENVDKFFRFPYKYHTLNNADLLPPDVELIPQNLATGSTKGQFIFPAVGNLELGPYVGLIPNPYPAMPYPLHHYHHQHHHHLRPHLVSHRPQRPSYSPHYPIPEPPVATIPPDVEVFSHGKPSTNRPFRPMPTSRPWQPPAMPSYYRSISEMRKSNQSVTNGEIDNSSRRSASDSSNDTVSKLVPETESSLSQTAEAFNLDEEVYRQVMPYGISNAGLLKLDESSAPMYILVPNEEEIESVNPHLEEESGEFHRPLSEFIATETSSNEDESASTDPTNAKADLNPLEKVPHADFGDETLQPANVDRTILNIEKLDAEFSNDTKFDVVQDAGGITEKVAEHKIWGDSENSEVSTERLDSVVDAMIKLQQTVDADSIYIEKVTEMNPDSQDSERVDSNEVPASARNRKFSQRTVHNK